MDEKLDLVLKRQRQRYQVLLALWKAAGGKELERVNFMEVAKNSGLGAETSEEILIYLTREGFFEKREFGDGVILSHKAIVEIERSLTNPTEATEHFSTTVIQNFNAPVGSIQTGPNSTANVNQYFGANMAEVAGLISQLREQFETLPPGPREEAIDVVDGLADELQQPAPSKGKVKAFLSQVGVFAQDVAAGASAGLLTEAIARSLGWQ
jgi:hypothetical protein